jgi:AcrR family transcriptional regulator
MSGRAATAADAGGAPPKRTRLAAPERRAAILDCACRVFAEGSFRGTTTAEIAAAAGVTEPILYRHFPSKKALYLACFDQVWEQVRALWDAAVAAEPDPARWARSMAVAYRNSGGLRDVISSLWLQALAEANEDPELRAFMRRHLAEVHAYIASVHRRAQEAGGLVSERDPDAEAWVSLAIGLLRASDDCVGGLVGEGFVRIDAARFEWLTGTKL